MLKNIWTGLISLITNKYYPVLLMMSNGFLPGVFHLNGKEEFNKEIENPAFEGRPEIVVTRMIEENNIVIAEGTVRAKKIDAEYINLFFCDVFEMKEGLIKQLTSYLMEVK